MTLRYLTAGESHGPGLCAIAEGFPAGVTVDLAAVDHDLARRQKGYGRGGRMKIETDKAQFLAGLRGGLTTGAPIALVIWNKDHENWKDLVSPAARGGKKFTAVRPGHADLAGSLKYGYDDARDALERASARNTATLVALGALARQLLVRLRRPGLLAGGLHRRGGPRRRGAAHGGRRAPPSRPPSSTSTRPRPRRP